MDYMKDFRDTCEMLCRELADANDKVKKAGKLTSGDLEYIDRLTHAIKSLKTVIAMEEANGTSGYYYDNGLAHELRQLAGRAHDETTRRDIERIANRMR